jgi:glycosyltransferase involved in cell wall biosynthesis
MSGREPRLLVVTVVHRPDDARILHRQIRSLREDGFVITYAAPWRAFGVLPPEGVEPRELPRSVGRRRIGAVWAARRLLLEEAAAHDLILLHDPELLVAVRLAGVQRLPPVVWDVHEDTAVALGDREWLPPRLRRVFAVLVHALERWAERNVHLILAEDGYRVRFRRSHPVVRNHPPRVVALEGASGADIPEGPARIVHVGRLSRGRGLLEMIALAERLGAEHRVELVGPVDDDVAEALATASAAGVVRWHGFVPNDRIGAFLAGAAVGLCLLHDDPNYRVSMPSKVIEYLAHGLPVVATPLPEVEALLGTGEVGVLVPFGDVDSAVEAVRTLVADPDRRRRMRTEALRLAEGRTWGTEASRLTSTLRGWLMPQDRP